MLGGGGAFRKWCQSILQDRKRSLSFCQGVRGSIGLGRGVKSGLRSWRGKKKQIAEVFLESFVVMTQQHAELRCYIIDQAEMNNRCQAPIKKIKKNSRKKPFFLELSTWWHIESSNFKREFLSWWCHLRVKKKNNHQAHAHMGQLVVHKHLPPLHWKKKKISNHLFIYLSILLVHLPPKMSARAC